MGGDEVLYKYSCPCIIEDISIYTGAKYYNTSSPYFGEKFDAEKFELSAKYEIHLKNPCPDPTKNPVNDIETFDVVDVNFAKLNTETLNHDEKKARFETHPQPRQASLACRGPQLGLVPIININHCLKSCEYVITYHWEDGK